MDHRCDESRALQSGWSGFGQNVQLLSPDKARLWSRFAFLFKAGQDPPPRSRIILCEMHPHDVRWGCKHPRVTVLPLPDGYHLQACDARGVVGPEDYLRLVDGVWSTKTITPSQEKERSVLITRLLFCSPSNVPGEAEGQRPVNCRRARTVQPAVVWCPKMTPAQCSNERLVFRLTQAQAGSFKV